MGGIDGRAIEKVASDKDEVWFFAQNLLDQAPQKSAIANVPQMHIADESGFSSLPSLGQVCEANGDARDPRPTRVHNPIDAERQRDCEQKLDSAVEINRNSKQRSCGQKYPGQERCREQKAEKTHPYGRCLVERSHDGVGVRKGKHRGGDKADGENAENYLEGGQLQWASADPSEGSGLVEKNVGEKEDCLNHRDKADEASS